MSSGSGAVAGWLYPGTRFCAALQGGVDDALQVASELPSDTLHAV
ncbi:hypothetical protein [Streptomyces atroolivaceus]